MRNICFLLIQDGEVQDYADRPCRFNWWSVRAFDGWQVAVGGINEFGDREVAGIIAEIHPVPRAAPDMLVSSELDGLDCLVDNYPCITGWVGSHLDSMYCRGRFRDMANLPHAMIVRPCPETLSASSR